MKALYGIGGDHPERGTGQRQRFSRSSGETPGARTFTKDVAPILYKNCTGCHRPGEIGPMSLLTYDDVRPRAKDIRDKVGDGVMPPWHADKTHGKFANDRSLSDEDKSVLLRWANNGAPKGDDKDLPPAPKYVEGWSLGQPDAVLQIPVDYKVPADGFVEYRVLRNPDQLHGRQMGPGARSAARRARRRASRHRDGPSAATRAAARRIHVSQREWTFQGADRRGGSRASR